MAWFKDLDGDCVVGTLVPSPVAFIYDRKSGKLTLGEMVGGAPELKLTAKEKDDLESKIGKASEFKLAEIQHGKYLCSQCNKWVLADSKHWSYGICLSCSMDRDSDRWSD